MKKIEINYLDMVQQNNSIHVDNIKLNKISETIRNTIDLDDEDVIEYIESVGNQNIKSFVSTKEDLLAKSLNGDL